MKKILVTGSNGFVGSHLLDLLIEKEPDSKLYGLLNINARKRNIKHILDKVEWMTADLTDAFSMIRVIKKTMPDEVYHLGALTCVEPSWFMPAVYMRVNGIGTINLLESILLADIKPRILVTGTPEVFGNVKQEDLPITEKFPLNAFNPYAASKIAQEAVCQTYHASYGMNIIRTRAFNHMGPRRDTTGAFASFSLQIVRIEKGLQEPVIKVGNLSATRNITHVKDIVRAYYKAMRYGKPGELYLIGSDNICTIKNVLESLIKMAKVDGIRYEIDPQRVRPTELKFFIGDFRKFKVLTGWTPKIPLKQTLEEILNYWRDFVDNKSY